MGTTPMRDWVRGRLTGRLDRDRLLREAALPASVADLIETVVRRTRLWRSEKVEVTRELIAHFRDGLAAGAAADQLIADFGEPGRSAKLIRRAKRRNRPLPWRAMIYTRNGIGLLLLALIAIYGVLAARYFSGRPTISRDYLAELNAPARAVPEADRAWSLYRQGMFLLPPVPPGYDKVAGMLDDLEPRDPRREPSIAYLRACAPALEKFAEAAAKPVLGTIISHDPDTELEAHWARLEGRTPAVSPPGRPDMGLVSVLIPSLGKFRSIARIVAADAQLAAIDRDPARVERDLRTLMGLSDHLTENPFLIGQLTGLALASLASEQVMHQVDRWPGLLADDQLRDLAHRLASVSHGEFRVHLAGELAFFDDTMQRLYTDDGHGDGRIAAGALHRARSIMTPEWPSGDSEFTAEDMFGPVVMGMTAGRAAVTRLQRSLVAEAQAFGDRKMWERGEPEVTSAIVELADDPISKARYWPAIMLMPAFDRLPATADVTTQRRDAALTAIALELSRRRTGEFPPSLDTLTPGLLPQLPPDQFDGQPIKYALLNGRPVLYSVGVDRKDDGGRPPAGPSTAESAWVSPAQARRMLADPVRRPRIDGDWILFPPARAEVPPPAATDEGGDTGPAS